MVAITKTTLGFGETAVTEVTLTGTADTFAFAPGARQILIFRNDTVAGITPTIKSDAPTEITVQGIGDVDISAGYTLPEIAADASVAIKLETISGYLTGAIEITGGTGLTASILVY